MIWGGMSAQDIVVLLTGIGAFIVTVGGFFAKLILDLKQVKNTQIAISSKQDEIGKKVDGLTEKAIAHATKAAKAEGVLEGKAGGEQMAVTAMELAKTIVTVPLGTNGEK